MQTGDLIWCYDDEPVAKAARVMEQHHLPRLPVLDRNMHLCGILYRGDLDRRNSDQQTSGEVLRAKSVSH